jgi:uncharacterized membrane protein (DUF373 family)
MSFGSQALRLYGLIERVIIVTLLILLVVVVLLATWTFTGMLLGRIASFFGGEVALDAEWTADLHNRMGLLRELFSGFLLLLIGIELMQTVVVYLRSHVLHVEVVLTVAIVAIARHTIDVDIEGTTPLHLIGTGFLLLALSVGYFFFRRAGVAADRQNPRP